MEVGELTKTARHRQVEPPKLLRSIRGDLDWMVMKCLEKDRIRRSETANDLTADLERHLTNEPVAARPPSHLYRLQKLARRNPLACATVGAVALVELWNVPSRRELTELKVHSSVVFGLAFSPDGRTLATACVDGTLRLWDAPGLGATEPDRTHEAA